MMEWTKKQTMDLVELLHLHECLWNVKIEEYKDRQKKKEAVEAIARVMEISPIDTEKKITNLKNQYNRELNKIKTKSTYCTDDVYFSTWYAFKALSFLKNHNYPRISRGSEYKPEEEGYDEELNHSQSTDTKDELNHLEEQEEIQEPTTSRDPLAMHEKGTPAKRLKTNQDESMSKETLDILNRQVKDEFDIFGEYIASELRGIRGVKNILDTKKEIQDLIYYRKLNQIMKHRINPQ